MKTGHRFFPFAAAIILVTLAAAPAASQGQKGGCQVLVGSVTAQHDGFNWVGQGYLTFDHGEPIATELVDRSMGAPRMTRQGLWGKEELTFTQKDQGGQTLGTIVMNVDFVAMATPVIFLSQYNATGTVAGTGIYENASGSVTIHGPALADSNVFQGLPPRAWPFVWMAEVHGSICGLNR
jgi:hypothetical protein